MTCHFSYVCKYIPDSSANISCSLDAYDDIVPSFSIVNECVKQKSLFAANKTIYIPASLLVKEYIIAFIELETVTPNT